MNIHLHLFTPRHPAPPCGRKDGMALVIVLGLISLLLISSITFAIMMRVERASSANARNTVMARQSAKSTLAYAIAAIDQNIGDKKWPEWQFANDRLQPYWTGTSDTSLTLKQTGAGHDYYFWKDTFGSVDHAIRGGTLKENEKRRAPARIMSSQMQYYLPYGTRHRAYAQLYKPNGSGKAFPQESHMVIAPDWVPMTAGTNAVNVNNIVGRCAFLALNTSGYLDLPAICRDGDNVERGYGGSPSEIQIVKDFFHSSYGGGEPGNKFKADNEGRSYETVAEIINANSGSDKDGSVFAAGAAYSAFNFSPVGCMPTNGLPQDLRYSSSTSDSDKGLPFLKRICIAGDGGAKHVKSLKQHKASILAAFYLSGLTASSAEFENRRKSVEIQDDKCTDKDCTVCGGTAKKGYTLPKDFFSEQALWAYLGLLDYIDEDDEPAYDSDIKLYKRNSDNIDAQMFARPAAEMMPLFNGFMATIKFIRQEMSMDVEVTVGYEADGMTPKKETRKVFNPTNVQYVVEFNGRVVSAFPVSYSGDLSKDYYVEGKLGFRFDDDDGSIWDEFADKARNANVKYLDDDSDDGGLYFTACLPYLDSLSGDGLFSIAGVTNTIKLADAVNPEDSDNAKDAKYPEFPMDVYVTACGATMENEGDSHLHRVPAFQSSYDTRDVQNGCWLTSHIERDKEGLSFKNATSTEFGSPVYLSAALASGGGQPTYKLKRKVVNVIMWGDMVDPRFMCLDNADLFGDLGMFRAAMPSHIVDPEGDELYEKSLSHLTGIDEIDELNSLMRPANNADFDSFVETFKKRGVGGLKKPYNYYRTSDEWDSCYTAFQEKLLAGGSLFEKFGGITDGSRRTGDGIETDPMDAQFHSLHARNEGLDSVGELGFLPVGLYSTIRLFGYTDEKDISGNEYLRTFNASPYKYGDTAVKNALAPEGRSYHRVLDFFSSRRSSARGLVNINTDNVHALASVFNKVPIDDDEYESIHEQMQRLNEGQAFDLAEFYRSSVVADGSSGGIRTLSCLSDLGKLWGYDESDVAGNIDIDTNRKREAVIRNSCGLFTDRGLNFSIVMRGEAFTPFFGRSDVRNDLGTTLASRPAFAQIWRDTVPDENGRYPFFVQYFKIFDE